MNSLSSDLREPNGTRDGSIGVVIPTFDAADFLPEALESVLKQSRALDEIVVVDDGSTDDTEDVVRNFSQHGVRYVKQSNQGSAAARNTGVRLLSTDYIAFLDTDDQWLPDKTAIQANILKHQPKVGIVSGDQIFWDPERSFRKVRKFSNQRSLVSFRDRLALMNVIGNPSMVMIRRSHFDRVGLFNVNLRFGDDWDMWLRLAAISDIAFASEPVAIYRWHGQNQSRSHEAACLSMYRQIARDAINRSLSTYKKPFAYPFLLRHTAMFMRYRAFRTVLGEFSRRIGLR